MPKRSYCFTAMTEMRGIQITSNWAQESMRAAINMGTGPFFCLFVGRDLRAAVEMGSFLVRLGFEYAYDYASQEADSKKLARAALNWRRGEISRDQVDTLIEHLQQKYARNFDSRPLMVAHRLASVNPCAVAAATCIDAVGADHEAIAGAIVDYARRVIRL